MLKFAHDKLSGVQLCARARSSKRSAPSRNISSSGKINADALADLALGNFIEMRDKTALKTFRAKKKLDHFLEAALPGFYLPLYTMVTFTRIPYAEAKRRARIQDRHRLRRSRWVISLPLSLAAPAEAGS
jgi:kynurenine 3-monooxygenase